MKFLIKFILVSFSSFLGILIILTADFINTNLFLNEKDKMIGDHDLNEGLWLRDKRGWYEPRPNFEGERIFGNLKYKIKVDSFGYRINDVEEDSKDKRLKTIVFLGDSFTWGSGLDWNETFPGQFSNRKNLKVINAAAESYSPTAHIWRYKKLLEKSILKDGDIIIMAVDLSDYVDEYQNWISSSNGPPFNKIKFDKLNYEKNRFKTFFVNNFQNTYKSYLFFKFSNSNIFDKYTIKPITNKFHSKTNQKKNLAIKQKLNKNIILTSKLAYENKHKFVILIYPWPSQILYPNSFEDSFGFNWANNMETICIKSFCDGVVNTIPAFRKYALKNPNWYEDLYINGDVHFKKEGNSLIVDELIKSKLID